MSTMIEHTPWSYTPYDPIWSGAHIYGVNGTPIADVWGEPYTPFDEHADGTVHFHQQPHCPANTNARLISAAPDLLAICQEIMDDGIDLRTSDRRIRLYAAIMKAIGREHFGPDTPDSAVIPSAVPLTVEERRDTAEEARRYTQHLHLLAKAAAEGDRTQHLPETGAGAAE
ncbi:MAG TPA: hypothetical protein VJA25_02520 [Dehalococcoidia bacterium]|nr:hypothetical protein [Dehalococcoidia bacterium]